MDTSEPRWWVRAVTPTDDAREQLAIYLFDFDFDAIIEDDDFSDVYFANRADAIRCAKTLGIDDPPHKSDPGTGDVFGQTLHPTTQLSLDLLPGIIRPTDHVADIGSGTGRLAQAAAEYSPHVVIVAVDPDRPAAEATRATLALSSLVIQGSADCLATASFDLILANLHLALWRGLAPEIARIAKPESRLIASGFLQEQLPEVEALLQLHCWRITQTRSADQWVALRAIRSGWLSL